MPFKLREFLLGQVRSNIQFHLEQEFNELKFLDVEDPMKLNIVHIVEIMLKTFQQQQRLVFKPNQTIIQNLENMGFERLAILEAMYITGNNQPNAVIMDQKNFTK